MDNILSFFTFRGAKWNIDVSQLITLYGLPWNGVNINPERFAGILPAMPGFLSESETRTPQGTGELKDPFPNESQ